MTALFEGFGSEILFARLASRIGTLHRYAHFYHAIFNEIDALKVFDDISRWLNTYVDIETDTGKNTLWTAP